MISFFVALIALVAGYLLYGRVIERIVKPTDTPTPAVQQADGVDFVVLPGWKIFMIQFLNIAGTGPIFGAIMGAWYGPYAYLWIVLGCIFAGAVHDYLVGMMSTRHQGAGLPELIGTYMGSTAKTIMLLFSILVLMMVGVVFVYSPAIILSNIWGSKMGWIIGIFLYYVLATLLPIDKIIGRVYPLFAFSLLFMAAALMVGLCVVWPNLPELWTDMSQYSYNLSAAQLGLESFQEINPIFPCMFITIACGAISGFHATQSPLMARCLTSEHQGRPIFYGAMITEGVVALIWATVSMYFFYYGGWREVCSPEVAAQFLQQIDGGKTLIQYFDAPSVVKHVCEGWLGWFGGLLALLGVVAAPITSGDTAFRSARLIIADFMHLSQRPIVNRLGVSLPMFAVAIALLVWQMESPNGFNVLWQYFGWSNQTLAAFALWTATLYLYRNQRNYFVTLVPALFMVMVTVTFLFVSSLAFGMSMPVSLTIGGAATIASLLAFIRCKKNTQRP